jgi:predicted acyltransferase
VDVLHYKAWANAGVVFGLNAIGIYVLSSLLALLFYGLNVGDVSLSSHFLTLLLSIGASPKFASMMVALVFVAINFIPAYILNQKRIFIKL